MLFALAFAFVLSTSSALADECEHIARVPLATTTYSEHLEYRLHNYDVPGYVRDQPYSGTRDDRPLWVELGDGNWCYDFGSIRAFQEAMGATGLVVTMGDEVFAIMNTDFTSFRVTGLSPGDVFRVEFVKPLTVDAGPCIRQVKDWRVNAVEGGFVVPTVDYMCNPVGLQLRVTESWQFVVSP